MSWDDNAAVVLDNGSGVVKAGFAGEDQPRGVFQAVVGQSRSDASTIIVGDEALETRGLTLKYPLEHGIVVDWDGMERVWRKMYDSLGVSPTDHAVLTTEAPMNPRVNREKTCEVFFESFGCPAMHIQVQAVMSLYSCGRNEGLVVDSGDGVTHTVPVYDGYCSPTSIRRLDLAGRDMTEWMMILLNDQNDLGLSTTADRETARRIKEQCCYVAEDFEAEMAKYDEDTEGTMSQPFQLPDGTEIKVGMAACGCPELFFNPAIAEKTCHSLPDTCMQSIQDSAVDIRRTLMHNVVLSGGSTMFKGIETRLQEELKNRVAVGARDEVRVVAPGERKYSVWMGAAILAGLSTFAQEWITREEYQENGQSIIHQRCDKLGFVGK